eukprot:4416775-Pyramimonas_sp.AAC.1
MRIQIIPKKLRQFLRQQHRSRKTRASKLYADRKGDGPGDAEDERSGRHHQEVQRQTMRWRGNSRTPRMKKKRGWYSTRETRVRRNTTCIFRCSWW